MNLVSNKNFPKFHLKDTFVYNKEFNSPYVCPKSFLSLGKCKNKILTKNTPKHQKILSESIEKL